MNDPQKFVLAAMAGVGLYLLYDRHRKASQTPPVAKPAGLLDSLCGISRKALGLASTEEADLYRPLGYVFMPGTEDDGYTPAFSLPAGMDPAMLPGLHEGSYVPEYVRSLQVGVT